jgi:acyl-homoserine-lactone acylase
MIRALAIHRSARLLAAALLLLPSCATRAAGRQVEVYRDTYGVPTIVAERFPDALYGLGYAMAQDNAVQMARNFKQARGRVAEVDGRSALLTDGFLRSLGIAELAEKKAAALTGEMKDDVDSFCEGANRALAEQKGKLPDWIEPFTPVDVLSMAQLTNASFALLDISRQLLPGMGSNQFAVSAARSATGHAILSIDPHLPWDGLLAWYEFGLNTKAFRFHGITLSGLPFGVMGHTDRVAWCMTNNDPDLFDFFTVKTNPDNPKQYSYHGEWRDFEETTAELRYRNGTELKSQKQRVRRTAWGPMVPFRSQAVALSMLGSWELLDQSVKMAQARDATELRNALRPLGMSMWNIVYADTQGHIGYQYNSRVPRRDTSFNWNKPVPGDDPKTKWGPLWTLDELPHVENPESGLLVNANSAPWVTPVGPGIASTGWPPYVTSYGSTTRYERLVELLKTESRVTPDLAKRIATDATVPYAKAALAYLGSVYASRHPEDKSRKEPSDRFIGVLSKWDGKATVDSRGTGLYYFWLRADTTMPRLAQRAAAGSQWSAEDGDSALRALQKAGDSMKALGLTPDARWGDIHVSRRGEKEFPVSGFNGPGGDAAVVPNNGPITGGKIVCNVGSSFRMIAHLDPKRVESWSILPYGASQDPANPHFADQTPLFGRGEYKDTLFGRARSGAAGFTRTVLIRSAPASVRR